MYCTKCGKSLNPQDHFCSFCGTPVQKNEVPKFESSQLDSDVIMKEKDRFEEEWEREERRERFTFAIFGVVIVVLLIAIVGGVVALLYSDREYMNDASLNAQQSQKREEILENRKEEVTNNKNIPVTIITPELAEPENTGQEDETKQEPSGEVTKEPTKEPTEAPTEEPEDEEYIIRDSDVRYLTSADLKELSAEDIRIARNEIFARHGRIFESQELQEYFETKSWYTPSIPAVEFSNTCLSVVEQENLQFIINYEKAHNLR